MATDTSARTFDALGDPTRRAILELLRDRGPLSAGEVASGFDVSRPAVSQHLTVLREAGVVETTRGKFGGYALARPANQIGVGEMDAAA